MNALSFLTQALLILVIFFLVLDVFEKIKEINKEGIAVVIVEQNAKQAVKLADRTYVLENGKIVLEGKGNELLGNEKVKKAYLGM